MKTKQIFTIAIVAIIAGLTLASCSKDDEKTNELQPAGITMITENNDYVGLALAGSGTITIDWGDGTAPENQTLKTYGQGGIEIFHDYASATNHTITITGEDITGLDCSDNQLTSLDVSNNTALTLFDCSDNQLTSLDVSKNTALTGLDCSDNQLTSLDVSKNTALIELSCYDNELTALNVNGCTKLEDLYCYYNAITSLDVSTCTALQELDLEGNQITTLDVTNCPGLYYLYCSDNLFTAVALNTLFGMLPTATGDNDFDIYIDENPGTDTCDTGIATAKGWTVHY